MHAWEFSLIESSVVISVMQQSYWSPGHQHAQTLCTVYLNHFIRVFFVLAWLRRRKHSGICQIKVGSFVRDWINKASGVKLWRSISILPQTCIRPDQNPFRCRRAASGSKWQSSAELNVIVLRGLKSANVYMHGVLPISFR